jgi:hypothetical protein
MVVKRYLLITSAVLSTIGLITGCGAEGPAPKSSSSLIASAQIDPESLYDSLSSQELTVEYYNNGTQVTGVTVAEKSETDILCQKRTAGSSDSYKCYQLNNAVDAAVSYGTTSATEFEVKFKDNGTPVTGTTTYEKNDSLHGVLCRKSTPSSGAPSYTYSCYLKI